MWTSRIFFPYIEAFLQVTAKQPGGSTSEELGAACTEGAKICPSPRVCTEGAKICPSPRAAAATGRGRASYYTTTARASSSVSCTMRWPSGGAGTFAKRSHSGRVERVCVVVFY